MELCLIIKAVLLKSFHNIHLWFMAENSFLKENSSLYSLNQRKNFIQKVIANFLSFMELLYPILYGNQDRTIYFIYSFSVKHNYYDWDRLAVLLTF